MGYYNNEDAEETGKICGKFIISILRYLKIKDY